MVHNFVSTPFSVRYVRLSTRLTEKGVLSRSASKYRPRARKAVFVAVRLGKGGALGLRISWIEHPRIRWLFFEDGLTNSMSVTSLDTTLAYSEWSRPAKLSQAACRLLKVGGDRVSAEGWTGVRRQCAI